MKRDIDTWQLLIQRTSILLIMACLVILLVAVICEKLS